jgi:hypothetical protein
MARCYAQAFSQGILADAQGTAQLGDILTQAYTGG